MTHSHDGAAVPASLPAVEVVLPAMLIDIGHRYRHDITALELYEATRGAWRVGSRRSGARYAFAVAGGVVHEVYEIDSWHRAGTTPYRVRPFVSFSVEGRWEFLGRLAPAQIRDSYKLKSVAKYLLVAHANSITYVNC